MKTLALLALLIVQEPRADLARDLSDDLIEVRERAHAELLKMGAPAYPILRRALESGDTEARARALAILKAPAFLSVPKIVADNLLLVGEESREAWEPALTDLFRAGKAALPLVREAAKHQNTLLAFRAAQIAAILESVPVDGLKFGIFVEAPEAEREGAVPGSEILINAAQYPISVEFVFPSGVEAVPPEPVDLRPAGSQAVFSRHDRIRRVSVGIEMRPGQVWMRSRYHLVTQYEQRGVPSGFGMAGRWTLKPVFQAGARGDRWGGCIEGPPVTITVR